MTTYSASDLAARRIRQVRGRHGWTVKELARRCKDAGAARLTASVITNLETRRRPGREITVEELLALASVLQVPPLLLIAPLGADETLEITPGHGKGSLDAAAWIADDDASPFGPLRIAREHERTPDGAVIRWLNTNPLTLVRQIRVLSATRSEPSTGPCAGKCPRGASSSPSNMNALTVYGMRLRDYAQWLASLGYEPLPCGAPRRSCAAGTSPASLDEPGDELPLAAMFDPAVDAWYRPRGEGLAMARTRDLWFDLGSAARPRGIPTTAAARTPSGGSRSGLTRTARRNRRRSPRRTPQKSTRRRWKATPSGEDYVDPKAGREKFGTVAVKHLRLRKVGASLEAAWVRIGIPQPRGPGLRRAVGQVRSSRRTSPGGSRTWPGR